MKTISEIYDEYEIIPNLREHMFRVAGVAAWLIEHSKISLASDRRNILSACLLHDMGNIIKFDFDKKQNMYPDVDLEYWKKVKVQFIERYGNDEHQAHLKIVKELGVSERTTGLIDSIGFNRVEGAINSQDLAKKICAYADLRVAPFGVAPLTLRITDGLERYNGTLNSDETLNIEKYHALSYILEEGISKEINLPLSLITDSSIAPYFKEFFDFVPI